MSDKEKSPLVPKLRFPEFCDTEGWKIEAIGQYLINCTAKVLFDTELPIYSSTRDGLKRQDAYFDGNVLQNSSDYGTVPPDCFVYRHMSDDGLFKFNINDTGGYIAVSKEYPVFRTKGLNSHFLLAKLNDGFEFRQFALSQKAGGTRTRLYFSRLGEWKTPLPSIAEQQKIADCLSSLDELIAAQARKVDALKTHKKGLMQQLFPRESETQPRLRFPEFQDSSKWTLDALENLCSAKISYGIVQAGPHVPGGMPYIKSSDLNSDICLETLSCTSKLIAEKYRRSEVLPGDIVFSLRGNIGMCRIVPDEISCANLTQGTARLRAKGSAEFLLQLIQSQSIGDKILAASKGSTFQEISLGILRTIPIVLPELDEQSRIADCLTGLDHFISVQTQELETLKIHKKGLMQQLFPSLEAVEA